MSEMLFEDPTWLYAAAVLAEVILLGLWLTRRTRRWAIALAAPVVFAGVVALVEQVVETDREQILAATDELVSAVERGDYQAVPAHLDEEFRFVLQDIAIDRARVVGLLEKNAAGRDIGDITLHGLSIEPSGRQATMDVTTVVRDSRGAAQASLVWKVLWYRRDGRWRILEVSQPRGGFRIRP